MQEKTFTGLYVDKQLLSLISFYMEEANARSRNDFIIQAIRFYIDYLRVSDSTTTLIPILDDAMDARMKDQEMRLSRILFKLAVEVAMMTHVVAGTNEINERQLAAIRKLCVDEVARLSGRYRFEDAVKFQNS